MTDHPLLLRQLRKLGLSVDDAPDLATWRQFISRVSCTYSEADQDRYTNERTLQLTSQEMSQLNQELVRANAVLRDAYADIELVVSSIPAIIIGVDADGRVSRWNQPAIAAFGLPESDAVGRVLLDLGVTWDRQAVVDLIDRSVAGRTTCECNDLRYQRPDGREGFLQASVNPGARTTGSGLAYLLLAIDVTERRVLESQRNHLLKMESIGQLAAGIAHEINTPVQFVGDNLRFLSDSLGNMQLILASVERLLPSRHDHVLAGKLLDDLAVLSAATDAAYLAAETPKAVSQSVEGVSRIARIVQAMKEFAHPDQVDKSPIDINRAITTTLTIAHSEYKYVADVVTDLCPDLPSVLGHPGELNQVFLNLIVNAAHAIGDVLRNGGRGTITIASRRSGETVELSITDTGTGIPESIRPHIFDPFFTTKGIGKGTGQGLYLADMIIRKKHGGSIAFTTAVGIGTTFIVTLPISRP